MNKLFVLLALGAGGWIGYRIYVAKQHGIPLDVALAHPTIPISALAAYFDMTNHDALVNATLPSIH